jgi:hypothetical protein
LGRRQRKREYKQTILTASGELEVSVELAASAESVELAASVESAESAE